MRKGFGGLVAIAQTAMERYQFSGHVFLFGGRRGDKVKRQWWSGDCMNLFAKRLEHGRFVWPQAQSGTVHLTSAQLPMLLEGIDCRRPARSWRPEMAASSRSPSIARWEYRRIGGRISDVCINLDQLPDDAESLKRLIVELQAKVVATTAMSGPQ